MVLLQEDKIRLHNDDKMGLFTRKLPFCEDIVLEVRVGGCIRVCWSCVLCARVCGMHTNTQPLTQATTHMHTYTYPGDPRAAACEGAREGRPSAEDPA